jgi:hypothetical protein
VHADRFRTDQSAAGGNAVEDTAVKTEIGFPSSMRQSAAPDDGGLPVVHNEVLH